MKYTKKLLIIVSIIVVLYISIYGAGSTVSKEFSVVENPDGGYLLNIVLSTRYWKLITSEGIFPSLQRTLAIELTGKGTNWTYRNQNGYYYSLNEIKCSQKEWDLGYAWISDDRRYLYLNLFWVNAPNSVISSDVNDRYLLKTMAKEL